MGFRGRISYEFINIGFVGKSLLTRCTCAGGGGGGQNTVRLMGGEGG